MGDPFGYAALLSKHFELLWDFESIQSVEPIASLYCMRVMAYREAWRRCRELENLYCKHALAARNPRANAQPPDAHPQRCGSPSDRLTGHRAPWSK